MSDAAESIVFNVVEGCGASSRKEFARFLDMAIKSSTELEEQLELAKDYGILDVRRWIVLSTETIVTRRMLYRLRKKVLESGE